VDVVGVGAGVVDQLEAEGYPVNGVNVGEGANDSEHYVNKRAELFWALRERHEDGEIDLDENDEELANQLTDIIYGFDVRGRIYIERKEDAKKRGVPSPDKADAVMLAFAPFDEGPAIVMGRG
jgi:phage terminase large subunit